MRGSDVRDYFYLFLLLDLLQFTKWKNHLRVIEDRPDFLDRFSTPVSPLRGIEKSSSLLPSGCLQPDWMVNVHFLDLINQRVSTVSDHTCGTPSPVSPSSCVVYVLPFTYLDWCSFKGVCNNSLQTIESPVSFLPENFSVFTNLPSSDGLLENRFTEVRTDEGV